jgi:dienelactone hydrolase
VARSPDIDFPDGRGGRLRGYLATPVADAPRPGVVVHLATDGAAD